MCFKAVFVLFLFLCVSIIYAGWNVLVNSSTTIKVRGKNIRVKIPTCRALKKLNNTEGKISYGVHWLCTLLLCISVNKCL